jgi:cytochrome c oxidase subunit 2
MRRSVFWHGVAAALAGAMLAGCDARHSALLTVAPEGRAIAQLFWIFTAICVVIWILVVVALLIGLMRRRQGRRDPLQKDPGEERRFGVIVLSLAGATAVIVAVLTVFSYGEQASLFGLDKQAGISIKLTGHQWWWQLDYENPQPDKSFTTANEIHVPVGVPVTVKLASTDVIHSFWVPSVMGKLDLIPGRENITHFTVEKAGIYRGYCAEFCGLQHAKMGLLLIAQLQPDFDAWQAQQIAAAPAPADAVKKGQDVFLSHPCMTCHAVRGTPAGGQVGPDLTHLASRATLAAGTLPFGRGPLAAWITDPQSNKPGAQMPQVKLEPMELAALLDYLESLK